MANGKDYYEILGLTKNASADDIKKAYRNLAREHHPDMVSENDKKDAEKRFKEINEAYQVLSDPQKKQMYDQYGQAGPGFSGGGSGPFGSAAGNWGPFTYSYSSSGGKQGFDNVDPFDIFEDFFGFRGFGGNRAPKKGKNLYYELHVEFKDALFGLEKEVNIESGKVKIKIPAGVHDGTEVKFAGKGMPGPDGAPTGDLFITIRYRMPAGFNRVGDHLVSVKELDAVTATLGDTIDIDVIDTKTNSGVGSTKLKIPGGTQHGTQFRVRGKGMPRLRGDGFGDLIVQVLVTVPKRISKKQRKILEDFKTA